MAVYRGLTLCGVTFSDDFNDSDKILFASSNIKDSIGPWLSSPSCKTLPEEGK